MIKKITIATPMYGGMCCGSYLLSVVQFIRYCAINSVGVEISYTNNESLIQRARNILANSFLNTDSDVILFIDADIKFDPRAMFDMIFENKDVIGAVTPLKRFSYQTIIEGSLALQSIEKAHLLGGAYNFNQTMTKEVEQDFLDGKPVKVERIGTGVLSIKKSVLLKMSEVVNKYRDDTAFGPNNMMFDFFPVVVQYDKNLGDNRLMSEDYSFCNTWMKLGGEIWAKDGVVKSHTGSFEYSQSLYEDILAQRKIQEKYENQ